MTYVGGKGRAYQHIISLMPPHREYIETYLGGGSVMKNKLPAKVNVGIDIDPCVASLWRSQRPDLTIVNVDAVRYLRQRCFSGDELVFCDPPYVPRTRRRARCYKYDYSEADHIRLLTLLVDIPCFVMITGHDDPLYRDALKTWYCSEYDNWTQRGRQTEFVWMNFEPGTTLHDYTFIGASFRARERMKRLKRSLLNKITAYSPMERNALLAELADHFPDQISRMVRFSSRIGCPPPSTDFEVEHANRIGSGPWHPQHERTDSRGSLT